MTEFEAEQQIKQLIDSGQYFQLGYELLESIKDIELDQDIKKLLESINDYYMDYLGDINKLSPDFRRIFLTTIKDADVIDNQSMEKEDSFLISIYRQIQKDNYAVDKIKKVSFFDPDSLKEIHEDLLKYTSSSQGKLSGFRDNDRKYVGYIDEYTNERVIEYFPVKSSEIENVAKKICDYINSPDEEENIFIKPIIVHGLIAAYQMFNDGNTRFARLVQHELIRRNTNNLGYSFEAPTFYATRLYYPLRAVYRGLITKLVLNHDNNAWKEWIKFNAKTFDNSIAVNYDNIVKLERSTIMNTEDKDINTRYYKNK